MKRLLILIAALLACLAPPALAQSFPALTGRVVDGAGIIPADEVARLDQKLAALEQQSHRQLVVATVPDLQGYDIADYGYQLGRAWGIGEKTTNNGLILLIAPKERKVRVEVGYGLEGIATDGLSTLIIQQQIIPRFKAGDMPGGIEAGADALIKQLILPEDEARKIAAMAKPVPAKSNQIVPALMWLGFIFLFVLLPIYRRAYSGSRYQDRSDRSSGLGPIVLWSVLDSMSRRGGGGGGGSDWGGGGGGGFSGGGGSFGGGGASGSW